MAQADIAVSDNPNASRFEALVEGHLAVAEYSLAPGAITFTHTRVPEALGGRGIGTALVQAGLTAARGRGLKVIPECSFFARYMQRHPETADLLHPDYRPIAEA